jgi:hydrogenase expression/formation protein HypE
VALVARDSVDTVLDTLTAMPQGAEARVVGRAVEEHPGMVVLRTGLGGTRVVDLLPGDQLPRIC